MGERRRSNWSPSFSEKTTLKKPSLIRVNPLSANFTKWSNRTFWDGDPGLIKVRGKDFIIRILLKKGKYFRKWCLSQHEIYKTLEKTKEDLSPRWDEQVKLEKRSVWWNNIFELYYGAKHPQYNSNFMNKFGGRSNTADPPTTIAIGHFQI